jgi:hypothetical protein
MVVVDNNNVGQVVFSPLFCVSLLSSNSQFVCSVISYSKFCSGYFLGELLQEAGGLFKKLWMCTL